MINKISFENYKAFDKGSIDIKPITILLGANSVGKSSILQLILMLQQTAQTDKHKSALKLHGEYISMGENENIFKDKITSKELKLSFQFTDDELASSLKGEYFDELKFSVARSYNLLRNYSATIKKSKQSVSNERMFIHIDEKGMDDIKIKSKKDFTQILNKINEIKKTLGKGNIPRQYDIFYRTDTSILFNPKLELNKQILNNYANVYGYLNAIKKIRSNLFNITFCISNVKIGKENVLKVTNVKLTNFNKIILDLTLKIDSEIGGYTNVILKSGFMRVKELLSEESKKDFLKNINYDSTLFYLINSRNRESFYLRENPSYKFPSIYLDILSNSITNVQQSFGKEMINYVSPLRAHPKRYYFLDKAKINTFLDTLDGDSLTEILKENNTVKRKVNDWLKNFNLSVDVSTLQDVIHNLKIRQNGLNLDITDVGFGISQVLPVIVQGFLSYKKSMTIIEQPEIHLHPKMQADLADLFIDIATHKPKGKIVPLKYLLIETHSEYLLKRMRRRIAENEIINAENVAIYYFHPRSSSTPGIIERKDISKTGFFEYPKDFYSGELLTDNVEFLKRQL